MSNEAKKRLTEMARWECVQSGAIAEFLRDYDVTPKANDSIASLKRELSETREQLTKCHARMAAANKALLGNTDG